MGGKQELDSLSQCVRCTFADSILTYHGKRDIEIVDPIVEGNCSLLLQRSLTFFFSYPTTVAHLKEVFGKCNIKDDTDAK